MNTMVNDSLSSTVPLANNPASYTGTVAYVMNGYPRLSETFIAHEIHQIEQMGLRLRLFSVKREYEDKVHPVVSAIHAPLSYLPKATSLSGTTLWRWLAQNLPAFWRANLSVALHHPLRYGRTLASALALSWRYRPRGAASVAEGDEAECTTGGIRLRKVFIKEFLQAGQIADEIERAGDVRHLHGHFCHGVATITWFASRMTGIPFSFTAHAKDIYQAELNPGTLLERKLNAARFVATCTCANADVLRVRHTRPDEIHTIYHGLDTDYFSPLTEAPSRALPMILSVGRFVEKKGFDQLIEACALLKQEGLRFECVIVGERGSAYPGMMALIKARQLADSVHLRSAVAQNELRDIYRAASAFALPCQVMEDGDRDGFPNVLAEAMAMGVPVVSTRISGIPEMIDDGMQGLLVEPRNARALADALRRVLTDSELHARLAHAGRQRICERFDSRRTTLVLRELFAAQLRERHESKEAAV
jgi:glycosyltransferase involved in cell wall biosynthesis